MGRNLSFAFAIILLFVVQILNAQCTDGTQPECSCGTAPVLCTVDQLDNYMFSMSSFQHPQDGPTPICGVGNSQSNNPTWFAFTAWCTDLTLEASFANCTTVAGNIGVQIAIFEDCSFNNPVACNVAPANCNVLPKTLTMTGLTIGGVYYFLVDGCLGSACDVTIDIIGTCGAEAIDPWTQPVTGEIAPCVGDTETYSVEMLPGAQTYHWYVDNVLQGMTSTTSFNQTWTTAGTFQLCVDASNDPCVPVTDPPAPNCITITVGDVDAGTLTVNPASLCPNEFSFITAAGYVTDPNNSQAIIIVDAAGVIVQVTPGDAATFTSAVCASFTVYSYNYLTATGTVPVVGMNISAIDCVANCCDLVSESLTFEDTMVPVFPNPPGNLTVDCSDLIPAMTDQSWTDNCDGTGMAMGTEQGNVTSCAGGTITRVWEYIDACGNTGNHTQTITVNPTLAPTFINPPANATVDCNNIPASAPDLSYTNNGAGACDISGTVSPVQTGSADNCGGTITYTWIFTDACGNTINHEQNITVTPAPAPAYINPPASETVSCDNIPTSAPDLSYTNNATVNCEIAGTVSPTQSGSADICGGTITYEWVFTDACGNALNHAQTISVTPASPAAFVNPPADVTFTCDNIPTSAPDLNYTNNEAGSCLVSGIATASQEGSADVCGGSFIYKWEFLDPCGNTIEHNQTVTIDPATPAAFINPPVDMTVSCDNIPTSAPDLSYTNNETGTCLVSGTVPAVQSGSADICGGTITFTWSFTDPCGNAITHAQNFTVDPALSPAFVNPPADLTVSCDNIPASAPDLSYTNNDVGNCLISGSVPATQSGSVDACGGTISFIWNFSDQCGNAITHTQNITVDPAPPAMFTSALPADITVACDAVPTSAPALNYTNNQTGVCEIAGSQPAVQNGSYNACGGDIQFVWEFTDACGRTIQHQQNVNVLPAPSPAFTNPPGNVTMDCSAVPASPPSLSYTNGGSGLCAISGSVPAIQSGFYDSCGGSITYTWSFTDACNNTITHSQTIQVNPASDPMFINPPADLTINCGVDFPTNVPLNYTNNEAGACGITGTVIATEVLSGLNTTYSWVFTNPCNGFTITHIQNVTQTAAPDIVLNPFQVTICAGEVFDLGSIAVTDLNGTNPVITFHTGTPADFSNQLPNGQVSPASSTTYYILASNSNGCSDEAPFDVVVEDPPFAGNDGFGTICFNDAFVVNFFDFLLGGPDQSGTWNDFNSYGVDVSNPYAVNLSGLAPGTYTFSYALPSGGVCPDDIATITLEVLPEIFFEATTISCSSDPNFYEVTINSFGFEITNLSGTATDQGGGVILISDIPIGDILVISATNPGHPTCLQFLSISPPDCDCPTIDPPINDGNNSICEGEVNPTLSVTVNAGETANWFDAPSGGALLIAGSTTYTPTETLPGTYTYYVQAEEIASGCVSSILTPVQFEIFANPIGVNAQLTACDDGDGFVVFDLTLSETLISSDLSLNFSFYENLLDAQNQMNALPVSYTNTSTPNQTLFVVLANSEGCFSIVELELIVLPLPTINLQIENETCLGDGDGSVTINSPNGINFSLDNITWTANNIFTGLTTGPYTAYVEDGDGCIASQNFVIEPGLEMIISIFDVLCNPNGTASDATDDFYDISFSLTNNDSNLGTYTVNDGTTDHGPFNYNQFQSISLPALGQSLTLTFTDDILSCSITQAIGPLNSCSTDCIITIDQLDIVCSDNDTGNDATDDFYTVTINASAINGSANGTYNVLINSIVSFNYPYNTVSTFTLPADGTSPIISVVDNQDAQCQATQTVGPLTPCSDACVIQFTAVDFTCDNNGTLTDPADDFYNVSIEASVVNPGASNSFEIFADNISQGIFTYATIGTFTLPADGATVQIEIQDIDEPLCFAIQDIGPLDPCEEDCTISAVVSNIVCEDSGTGNDSTDDTFTFDVLVNGQNVGSGWESTDGTLSGSYGTVESFGPYLISGGDLNFDLEDLTTAICQTPIIVAAPPACSDPCTISFAQLDFTCDDNGTLTNASDDFYNVSVEAAVVNPGASNSFEIFADNVSQGIYTYATIGTFTLPADGATVQIEIQDADEPLCFATQDIGPLDPCEEDCTISAVVSNIVCDDNGTTNDSTDDTFTFDVLVNGQNVGSGWESTDGTLSGSYGAVESFGPYLISGGDLNFDLEDLTTAGCLEPITVAAPPACSDPCTISFAQLDFICDDNGTLTNASDDFYNVSVEAAVVNPGASNSFEIFADNVSQGIFTYSTIGTFTLPADGATVQIEIQDTDEPLCFATQDIGPLDPCEEDCTINATMSSFNCDDNGTANDSTDDTFTFDVLVNGQNVGSGWESTDGTLSGSYGVLESFGPYLISGGDLNFDLEDLTTAGCQVPITVFAPPTCSASCLIDIALLFTDCNNNGTITDPSDDFYDVELEVSIVNPGPSNTFDVYSGANYIGTFSYVGIANFNLPTNTTLTPLTIQDSDFPLCSFSTMLNPLLPCAEDCTIAATVSNIICFDNDTGNDSTDDTFTFDVLVNGQNVGSGWESTDGTLSGSYGTVESFGPYLISGGDLNFDLEDLATAGCLVPISVTAPPACSEPCTISFDLLDFTCDDNGTLTNPADDFYTITVQASAMNPGAANSFEVFADNVSQGIFTYATSGTFVLPANGATVQIEIQDADEPLCFTTQDIGPLDSCEEDCTINAIVSNIICDDNGTGNDSTDDTFTFDVLVNGQNVGSGWESTDGTLSGGYGVVESFGPYLISGGNLNFDLQDLTTAICLAPIIVAAPPACSEPCIISFTQLDFTCDDNGTLTIPGDDFYNITIQATAVNPVANSYEVFADNVSQGIFTYAAGGTFTLPANGATVQIEIQDIAEPLCIAAQNIGPLDPCAEDCTINASVSNIICDDNGTGNDTTDDTFTFDVLVNGQNVGSGWESTDGTLSGNYGAVESFGPYLISSGDLNFDLEDLTTPNCIANIIVPAPTTCSSCVQTIDAGLTDTITCEITTVDLNGTSSAPGVFSWTGPNSFTANTLMADANQSGWYYLTGTYPDFCVAIDSVFIAIENNVPTADAGPDRFITCDSMQVTLDGSGSTGNNLIYEWTFGGVVIGDQPMIIVSDIGIYTLQVTDGISGCIAIDQVEVFDDSGLPSAAIYADPVDILDCVVNTISLSSDNEADVIYNWNSELIGPIYSVSEGGLVFLVATDTISGCVNTNEINIADLEDYPLVELDPATPLSCYDPEIMIDGSGSQQGMNIIYNWYDAGNNLIPDANGNTLQVDVGGFYFLQLVDTTNGCQNTDTVFVESLFELPLTQAVDDVNLYCAESTTALALELLGSPTSVNINWSTNDGNILSGGDTQNPMVNGAGIYTVAIQDLNSGCIALDSLIVNIDEDVPDFANTTVQAENCIDENDGLISVSDIDGGQVPYLYSLNGSPLSSANEFPDLSPGQYALQIQDDNGCMLDTSFVVEPGVDLEVDLPAIIELIEDQNGNIQAVVNVPEEELTTIQWSPPGLLSCDTCLITSIIAQENQTFQLYIQHENGCLTIADLRIEVKPKSRVYIPNAFSPNEDGSNEYFTLYGNEQVEEIEELIIFDRWGEFVFRNENFAPNAPSLGWDGTLKGEDMNPAVFVYYFRVKMVNGGVEEFSGDVTLVR